MGKSDEVLYVHGKVFSLSHHIGFALKKNKKHWGVSVTIEKIY